MDPNSIGIQFTIGRFWWFVPQGCQICPQGLAFHLPFIYSFFFFFFLHLYFFGLKIFVVMFSPYFQPYPLLFQTCLFLCSECRDQMNLFSCSDEMVVLFHTHTCLCVYDVTLIQFCCLMDIYRFLCECVTSTKFPPELSDMISFLPFFFQNIRNFFSVLYAHTW